MTVTKRKPAVPPMAITGMLHAFWAIGALRAAVELDVFGPLADGAKTAEQVAQQIGAHSRGVELLLDALVGLELVSRHEGRYRLTDASELYLVPSSPLFLGPYLSLTEELHQKWSSLPAVTKTGKPTAEVNLQQSAEEFFPELASTLFATNYATAQMVADALALDELPVGARVLDVAAGSGVWSIALAEAHRGFKLDMLDFPAVLEVARKFSDKYGVADRCRYLAGNWREVPLDHESYDIVVLGHILHSEGLSASTELLAKCHKSMKKGGLLVIAEFMPNDDRTAPALPLLFALNMYLLTTAGCVFTPGELESMLQATGFEETYRLELPYYGKESPILVATRK